LLDHELQFVAFGVEHHIFFGSVFDAVHIDGFHYFEYVDLDVSAHSDFLREQTHNQIQGFGGDVQLQCLCERLIQVSLLLLESAVIVVVGVCALEYRDVNVEEFYLIQTREFLAEVQAFGGQNRELPFSEFD